MNTTNAAPSSDQRKHQEIVPRSARRGPGLLQLAVFAIPVWMALAPVPAAGGSVGSSSSNANISMPTGVWTVLDRINLTPLEQNCVAMGSADVGNPAGNVGTYLFTLSINSANPPIDLGRERTVQFVAGGPSSKAVATTAGFIVPRSSSSVIYWLGRPAAGSPATLAMDRSLTVVCDNTSLGMY